MRETLTRPRTGETVRTRLAGIDKRVKEDKEAKIYSLAYLLNINTLREAFKKLPIEAAPGIDGISKEEYGRNLEDNLSKLMNKLKSCSYKPNPVGRVYIPKQGSNKMRPLGLPTTEDKIVQKAIVIILESIYEQDFLNMSYGFRPNRSCHDALKDLSRNIGTKKVGYIVDADIKGFFDNVNHEWMIKMLEHRIKDTKMIRLIKRFLKAGVMEDRKIDISETGVPQGGPLSPLLGNIYLHYVLDLWFEKAVKKAI